VVCGLGESARNGDGSSDAPEIDGSVFLNGDTALQAGDIVKARVTHADEYDLWGERA